MWPKMSFGNINSSIFPSANVTNDIPGQPSIALHLMNVTAYNSLASSRHDSFWPLSTPSSRLREEETAGSSYVYKTDCNPDALDIKSVDNCSLFKPKEDVRAPYFRNCKLAAEYVIKKHASNLKEAEDIFREGHHDAAQKFGILCRHLITIKEIDGKKRKYISYEKKLCKLMLKDKLKSDSGFISTNKSSIYYEDVQKIEAALLKIRDDL